ncbi:hypothetical protein QA640_22355 [Bradyrhizobium sp. CB82]|uniref:hypothetical protein n=1 Tax=Bradyrhizobium sp. CB82 TaxID=3039159 RepID=UPI0024B0FA20|nr:hypothetical protein [Bradyrhizobium sp. CB82]WFU37244.1 hypothetical protein QA640_22355 [Bradyrhizobium sp. CB82]
MANRTIAGTVRKDGTIISGAEFSVEKTNRGEYVVSFRPAFSNVHGGSATQIYEGKDGSTLDNVVLRVLNVNNAIVATGGHKGDLNDRDFTFVFNGS